MNGGIFNLTSTISQAESGMLSGRSYRTHCKPPLAERIETLQVDNECEKHAVEFQKQGLKLVNTVLGGL